MQYFQQPKPSDGERYIHIGDGEKVKIKTIRKFRLLLKTGFYLNLNEIYIVSSFGRNLIYISTMYKYGFTYYFRIKKKKLVGFMI